MQACTIYFFYASQEKMLSSTNSADLLIWKRRFKQAQAAVFEKLFTQDIPNIISYITFEWKIERAYLALGYYAVKW